MSLLGTLRERTIRALLFLFFSERTPLFVSAFLGAVAWSFSHVVDRAGDAPFVAYSVSHQSIPDPKQSGVNRTTVRIQNLSKSKSFKNVVLILRRADESVDTLFLTQPNMADLRGVPPASTGDSEVDVDIDAAQFTIAALPPLARFELTAHYRGRDKPVLTVNPDMPDAFVLAEESLHTLVLRHEHELISASLVVWLLLILLWAFIHRIEQPIEDRKRWRRR